MNQHKIKDETIAFPVYSLELEHFSELSEVSFPSEYFVLLLAADYSALAEKEISDVSLLLIDRGLKYILCWGNDCEKAHDAFDLGNILWEEENATENHVMSTWHNDESFEEALRFCLYNALLGDEFRNKTNIVVVSVSNAVTNQKLGFLNDICSLHNAVGVQQICPVDVISENQGEINENS
ncbi:MAG: hypothetical protein ACI93R_003069 [Flavobacteriales bacterium]|jgi:hypothetical protein